ncbi:hypothetical protein HYZ78_01235 [Candidatus Microgenomates bacterium]|nr:hypothetical protein [Candidatus Microgenomates bacterium]
MNDESTKQLIKRLDLIVSMKINPLKDIATDQEKIQRLDSFGFTPTEIASILDSSSDKISKQLYVVRNKKKRKK